MSVGRAKFLTYPSATWPRREALAAASGPLVMCEASMNVSNRPGARAGDNSCVEISRPSRAPLVR